MSWDSLFKYKLKGEKSPGLYAFLEEQNIKSICATKLYKRINHSKSKTSLFNHTCPDLKWIRFACMTSPSPSNMSLDRWSISNDCAPILILSIWDSCEELLLASDCYLLVRLFNSLISFESTLCSLQCSQL